MKVREFKKHLTSGRVAPVYFFHGPERVLMEEALRSLKSVLLPPGLEPLNQHLLNAESSDAEEVVLQCETLPLFSDQRMVVVQDVEHWRVPEPLLEYLNRPCPSTCLVLVARKVDSRKKLFSVLKKKAVEVLFDITPGEMSEWIRQAAAVLKLSLSPAAVRYLKEQSGGDLSQVRNELEKISLLYPEQELLDIREIEPVLTGQDTHTVFEWLDAISKRDVERALVLLGHLLDAGEAPLALLALLAGRFRRNPTAAVPGPQTLALCLNADSTLKLSRLSARMVLEDLIQDLCGKFRYRSAIGDPLRGLRWLGN